jgi:hypothetical protein
MFVISEVIWLFTHTLLDSIYKFYPKDRHKIFRDPKQIKNESFKGNSFTQKLLFNTCPRNTTNALSGGTQSHKHTNHFTQLTQLLRG